jgi:hypothetical protein
VLGTISGPRGSAIPIVLALSLWAAHCPAEPDSTLSFDLLLAPSAPGFVLLGVEPSAVERPGTPSDLALAILSHTGDLSHLPENLALQFSPYWLFFGQHITFERFADHRDPGQNLLQTLSLSLAYSTSDSLPDLPSTPLALGIRCSPLRGRIDPEFDGYARRLESLYEELDRLSEVFHEKWATRIEEDSTIRALFDGFLAADDSLKPLLEPLIQAQIAEREAEIRTHVETEIRQEHTARIQSVREILSGLRFRRIGWTLDLAGGLVIEFPGRRFDDGQIGRWGGWLTGGFVGRSLSALALARYLGYRDESEESLLDLGARFILDDPGRFSLSVEGIYRKRLNGDGSRDTWRLAFIFDYEIARNKALSLAFGRDFEGKRSANLIVSLSVLLGFGSNRPIL